MLANFSVVCIQTGHTDLLPRRFVEGPGKGAGFFGFNCNYQYIGWLQGNHFKFFNFSDMLVSVGPKVTKSHLVKSLTNIL